MRSPVYGLGTAVILMLTGSGATASEPTFSSSNVCPLPISTCQLKPGPLDISDSVPFFAPECPDGYECACVPSCPLCKDCAAQVCVRAKSAECKTACDCKPGIGCFNGRCIPGFAPVYCCDSDVCPMHQQCQHRDGKTDRCPGVCIDELWLCNFDGLSDEDACGPDRHCVCTSPFPPCDFCERPEICGPPVCVPPRTPNPYHCMDDGTCANPGDRCVCVSSEQGTDDCPLAVCVPDRCEDPMCKKRVHKVTRWIERKVELTNACNESEQCVRIDTSTECVGTCGAWVNRSYIRRLKRTISIIDRRVCGTYLEDGCPRLTPACRFEQGRCIAGRCVGVPLSIGPRPEIGESNLGTYGFVELERAP